MSNHTPLWLRWGLVLAVLAGFSCGRKSGPRQGASDAAVEAAPLGDAIAVAGTGGTFGTGGTPGAVDASVDGQAACGTAQPLSYQDQCTGTTFFPDGACLDGECATIPLEMQVLREWRAQTKALSGLDDVELARRAQVAALSHTKRGDRTVVRIDYVVVLDWVRSRQADTAEVRTEPAAIPTTDGDIQRAVNLAILKAHWTGLGAIDEVVPVSAIQAAFDGCGCGMSIDFCHIDFDVTSGSLRVPGIVKVAPDRNECRQAKASVATGQLEQCAGTVCNIR